MMARPLLAALAAASVIVSVGVGSASASAPRATCFPRHSHTILLTRSTRVFWMRSHHRADWVVFGCLRARRHPVRVGSGFEFGSATADKQPETYRVSGPLLGVGETDCDRGGDCYVSIRVLDLRSGSVINSAAFSLARIQSFAMTRSGTVAALVQFRLERPATLLAVRRGQQQTLDQGNDIDPHSLVLRGSTLNWTKGGTAYSAALD
jgi:hypothetical protein